MLLLENVLENITIYVNRTATQKEDDSGGNIIISILRQ